MPSMHSLACACKTCGRGRWRPKCPESSECRSGYQTNILFLMKRIRVPADVSIGSHLSYGLRPVCRTASLAVPSPATWAAAAMRQLGREDSITPYWVHAVIVSAKVTRPAIAPVHDCTAARYRSLVVACEMAACPVHLLPCLTGCMSRCALVGRMP